MGTGSPEDTGEKRHKIRMKDIPQNNKQKNDDIYRNQQSGKDKFDENNRSEMRNDTLSIDKKELPTIKKNEGSNIIEGTEISSGVVEKKIIEVPGRKSLRKTDEQGFAPSLIEMLKHKDEKVRISAVESLLKIGDETLGYAFASCMKDASYQVRLGALRGIYKFAGDLASDYIVTALEDTHPDVRRRAVIYLGWLRKKELVPYITDALSDTSALVRKVATYTLGDLKESSTVPHLIKILDDTNLDVKIGALSALKRITRKSFDSEKSSSEAVSQEIIAKWKEWWANEYK